MSRLICVLSLMIFAFTAMAQPSTNQEIHAATGIVIQLMPAEKQIQIKHDAIPGYMQAMTMPFDVKDTNELSGLAPGDQVSFRVLVSGNYGWIDHLQKTGAKTTVLPLTNPFHAVPDVEELKEGDLLPEYHFTNQLGQAVNTAQFKGQALAITFLFTRCPFPQYCPYLANNFAEVQNKLLATSNAPTNWHLLTISFDPEFDTPEVLQRYAEAHDANSNCWTFATGSVTNVTAIGQQFGLAFWKEGEGVISHNLRVAVIDPSGRVQKIFTGNNWQPADLEAEILKAAKP